MQPVQIPPVSHKSGKSAVCPLRFVDVIGSTRRVQFHDRVCYVVQKCCSFPRSGWCFYVGKNLLNSAVALVFCASQRKVAHEPREPCLGGSDLSCWYTRLFYACLLTCLLYSCDRLRSPVTGTGIRLSRGSYCHLDSIGSEPL